MSCESITYEIVHRTLCGPSWAILKAHHTAAGHREDISMQWNTFLIAIPDHQVHWLYQQVLLSFLVTNLREHDSHVRQKWPWRLSELTIPLAWDSPVLLDRIYHVTSSLTSLTRSQPASLRTGCFFKKLAGISTADGAGPVRLKNIEKI